MLVGGRVNVFWIGAVNTEVKVGFGSSFASIKSGQVPCFDQVRLGSQVRLGLGLSVGR